jgi:DNA-binding XRE family transcriptional regulator
LGKFESRLREVLEAKGIKYAHVYKTVGFNKSTMTDYVNGKIPSYKNAYRIARLIGEPMERIWYEVDNEEKSPDN